MFSPEFTAMCDACGEGTLWFKANRASDTRQGVLVLKGYKCAKCNAFETKVLDMRGRIHQRE